WTFGNATNLPVYAHPRVAFDAARSVMVLFGDDDRIFESTGGGDWVEPAGSPTSGISAGRAVYDRADAKVLDLNGQLTSLSGWDGTAWLAYDIPPNRSDAEIAYDTVRDRLVVTGGFD